MNQAALQTGVYLHVVRLDVDDATADACKAVLSADEKRRAERFVRASDGRQWCVCRAGLRRILAHHLGSDETSLEFDVASQGKPFLPQDPALHFNLSHSGTLALVAVTRAAPVGVDLELVRPIPDWSRVAARFFSVAEQQQLAAVDPAERELGFYRCWTRKEAVIKCTGEGLAALLTGFDVTLGAEADAAVLADRQAPDGLPPWRMHGLEPADGYTAAAALRAADDISWHLVDQ